HQPGVRIGGETLAADLLAKVRELLFAETALDEGARVKARRAMALEIDQVAAMGLVGGMPEMHEAGVIEGRGRLEARNMAAEFGGFLVRFDHDRGGVPAHIAANLLLDLAIARMGRLGLGGNGVDVSGVGGEGQLRALAPRGRDHRLQDVVDLAASLEGLDRIERVQPFAGLVGLVLDPVVQSGRPPARPYESRKRVAVFSRANRLGNRGLLRRRHAARAWSLSALDARRPPR